MLYILGSHFFYLLYLLWYVCQLALLLLQSCFGLKELLELSQHWCRWWSRACTERGTHSVHTCGHAQTPTRFEAVREEITVVVAGDVWVDMRTHTVKTWLDYVCTLPCCTNSKYRILHQVVMTLPANHYTAKGNLRNGTLTPDTYQHRQAY